MKPYGQRAGDVTLFPTGTTRQGRGETDTSPDAVEAYRAMCSGIRSSTCRDLGYIVGIDDFGCFSARMRSRAQARP